MTKEYLVTDFYHLEKHNNKSPKKFLEIPIFDKKNKLQKNILYKKWKNQNEKIKEHNNNVKLHKYYLKKLTVYLNKYHRKNFSKRYWEIILTPWLWRFISSITFKWNLINNIKKNKFIFLKKKIDFNDIIPVGIEDFVKISTSNYWNHYIFSRIIEHSFSKKIQIKKVEDVKNIPEKLLIYDKLKHITLKEKISLFIQKLLNTLPQRKKYLIFSTYMSNIQEIHLNFLVNKSILFYKALRPSFLLNKIRKKKRKTFQKLISTEKGVKDFLNNEILKNIPSSYLENFNEIEEIVKKIPFPKKPQKIFTCLGFNRSTIMDRYIANNLENGSSLILAQHGGNYFQHRFHYDTEYEPKISDIYLTWGNIRKRNIKSVGILKKIEKTKSSSNKIILEVRMRKGYTRLKVDSGFFEDKRYVENLCNLFSTIKNKQINKNFYVKLHRIKWAWNEKKQFKIRNPNLKFLDERKKMIDVINSAKLVIHTFCSTGHLESLAANRPTLILFINDMKLYNEKSQKYFKKFEKAGILHTNYKSFLKFLLKMDNEKKIHKWWNDKKLQDLLNNYRYEFGFFNKNKITDLKKIILHG